MPAFCLTGSAEPAGRLLNRRSRSGWSLVEVIFAVAIAAAMIAASIVAYLEQAQRAAVQKAEVLVSQIETVKQVMRKSIDFGECAAPADDVALARQVLQEVKVSGVQLVGDPDTDAHTLGFAGVSVGTLDTVDADGNVNPGNSATVTLPNGVTVDRTTR